MDACEPLHTQQEADYYKDLGIPRSADEKEIKSAFRKAARTCHPDVAPDKSAEWAKVSNAYGVLSDPEQKKRCVTCEMILNCFLVVA